MSEKNNSYKYMKKSAHEKNSKKANRRKKTDFEKLTKAIDEIIKTSKEITEKLKNQ